MSLQLRRGTFAELETITPAFAEPIWTTDTHQLFVGDGVTPGGFLAGGSGGGVTEIIAGDNISINTSTGAVTISAAGGSGSTSTYTDLTVLNDLFFGSGLDLSYISVEDGALRFKSANGNFAFDSLDEEGVNVVSSNQITASQLMPLVNANTGTIIVNGQLKFNTVDLALQFYDDTVQTTAYVPGAELGDLQVDGTWLRNSGTGNIFISPQDGQTWLTLPSDDQSGSSAVVLANVNTGSVSIASGSNNWFFNSDGSLTFPDNTVQTTAAVPGQTGLYARDALPAGNPGLTITISDSGTDANSPAGNYALAYWDADTSEWLYMANSNSVTAI